MELSRPPVAAGDCVLNFIFEIELSFYKDSWVAQPAERVAVNHLVGGSNPSPGAILRQAQDLPININSS